MDRGFSQKITKKLLPGKNTGKYLIAAAAAVLLLVLFSDFLFPEKAETEKTESDYISQLEEKLETVLSETKGVGPCEVVITAVGGNEYVYATEKTDKSKSSVSGEFKYFGSPSEIILPPNAITFPAMSIMGNITLSRKAS